MYEYHNVLDVEALESLETQLILVCMASDVSREWLSSVSGRGS